MKLTYTITEEDYIQFNLFHFENSKMGSRQILMIRLLGPILMLAVALSFWQFLGFDPLFSTVFFVVASIGLWFWNGKNYQRSLRKATKKLLREGKTNDFIGEKTLTLLEDRICEEGKASKHEVSYHVVERIEENEDCIYIYTGSISAYIIPTYAFRDESQKEEFIKTIKEKNN